MFFLIHIFIPDQEVDGKMVTFLFLKDLQAQKTQNG